MNVASAAISHLIADAVLHQALAQFSRLTQFSQSDAIGNAEVARAEVRYGFVEDDMQVAVVSADDRFWTERVNADVRRA